MQRYVHPQLALAASSSFSVNNPDQQVTHLHVAPLNVCDPAGTVESQVWSTPFLQLGKEMDNPQQKMAADCAEEDSGGQGPLYHEYRDCACGLELLQFNWFRAAKQLCNFFTQCNSFTSRQGLQAGRQLSSWCDDCWSSHILSAMDGLTQICMSKKRLLKWEFIDCVRERHLKYWPPFS